MEPTAIAQAYDDIAERFHAARSRTVGVDYADRFAALLPPRGDVLELGCGTGIPLTARLVARGFDVHGFDASPRMIDLARLNVPGATFDVADMTRWKPSHPYDGVFAWDSVFHLMPSAQGAVIGMLGRALRTNGVALLTVGGRAGEISSAMFERTFYYSALTVDEYQMTFHQHGLRLVFREMDQPDANAHIVLCARKAEQAAPDNR
ncbi:MAG: class I SAM-dependent methyltransferase [Vicinamibacterales bacterium]